MNYMGSRFPNQMLKRSVLYTPLDIFCSSDCEIDIAVSSLCNAWC